MHGAIQVHTYPSNRKLVTVIAVRHIVSVEPYVPQGQYSDSIKEPIAIIKLVDGRSITPIENWETVMSMIKSAEEAAANLSER